jgi:ABC-type multidrug transport system permease subunit
MTCGNYTANYFSYGAPGYIANPDAMQPEMCGYCTYSSGKEFYSTNFGWDEHNKWRNLGVVAAFFVFNMFCFCALVFLTRKGRR